MKKIDTSKLKKIDISKFTKPLLENIDKIGKLSRLYRILISLGIFAVLIGPFFYFVYMPKLEKIIQLRKEHETLETKLARFQNKAKQLKKWRAKMEKAKCDRGVFVSDKFTPAAVRKLAKEDIKAFPEGKMPRIGAVTLYSTTRKLVDSLCRAKCGKVPQRESDCDGFSDDGYSCEVRRISDDASFHLNHMWLSLLLRDTQRLYMLQRH